MQLRSGVIADATSTPQLRIIPANEASWGEIQAVFGTRGDPSRCWCQRFKMQPGESWASVGPGELAFRLRQQTDCGTTGAPIAWRGAVVGLTTLPAPTAFHVYAICG